MKTFTTAFTIATLAITAVFAAPIESTSDKLVARSDYVRLCKNSNFGDCSDYWKATGTCVGMTSSMNDQVSSLDTYGATCTFFMDGGCGGTPWTTSGSFATIPGQYNDKISSFRCNN